MPHHVKLALAATCLAACAGQQKAAPEKGTVKVEVDRVMPMNESLASSAVEVTLTLKNPTGTAVKVDRVDYKIDTGDVGGVLQGSAQGGDMIQPTQEVEVKFRQSIPFPEDDTAYRAVFDRSTIPFDLKGTVHIAGGGAVGFERVGEVATPNLPKLIVFDAQAARYGKEGIDVTIFLRLINENIFPVTIEGVEYTVWIEEKQVKQEQAALGQRLIAGAAEEYEVSQSLDASTFGKDKVQSILQSRKVTFRVEGKVEIHRVTIPFEHKGEIELATGE